MKKEYIEKAVVLTQECIEGWFGGDESIFTKCLTDNVILIGAYNGVFCIGKTDAIEKLKKTTEVNKDLKIVLTKQSYHPYTLDAKSCIVTGTYCLTEVEGEKVLRTVQQRISYIWKLIDGELRIIHVHESNEYTESEADSRKLTSNRELMGVLNPKCNPGGEYLDISAANGNTYHLHRQEVYYLEADNEYVNVHTAHEIINVHRSMHSFLEKEFPNLLRIHRSYAVNRNMVRSFRPYEVTLQNGDTVPVSRKKYNEFREMLRTE